MKQYLICILCILLGFSSTTFAQSKESPAKPKKQKKEESFDEFMKQQEQEFNKSQLRQEQSYRSYKQKVDKEFGDALRQTWKEAKVDKKVDADKTPKPKITPKAPETAPQTEPKELEPSEEPETPLQQNVPRPKAPSVLKVPVNPQEPVNEDSPTLTVNYFRAKITLPYLEDFKVGIAESLSPGAIANYWEAQINKDYIYFIQQILRQRIQMNLNDWGYYLLLKEIATQIAGGDRNEATLFTWFMLLQTGYQVKIGYANNTAYLLMPANKTIYANTYHRIGGLIYYALDAPLHPLSLRIYEKDYPDANNIMQLELVKELKITNELAYRDLSFEHNFMNYSVKIAYNPGVIDFYNQYPLTDLSVVFNAPPTQLAAQSLKESLKPFVEGKTEKQAVNFLLSFVQKGFEYQTDDQQFNREKPLYIEETLHYPYSDCEDRSVFFAYLVKEILGSDIVGLDYPGHITTAIHFEEDFAGDFIEHDGKKYIICDPTFINAQAGHAMNFYRDLQAKIITLD